MTKEQEEAISRLRKITNRQILYGNKFGITIEGFKELQEDLETVLNMLKEKEAEIEKYKKLLVDNLAKELNNSIKAKEKANTDLEDLNIGWQLELEKKDKMIDLRNKELIIKEDELKFSDEERIKLNKMIDLMAEQLIGLPVNKIKQDFEKPNFKAEITIFTDKEDIKQHFERKATNDG